MWIEGAGNTVFVWTEDSIYRSLNNGTTWSTVDFGPFDVGRVESFSVSDSAIFIGTNNGAFQSTDNGDSWTGFGEALDSVPTLQGNPVVSSVKIKNGYTFANIFSFYMSSRGYNYIYRSANNGKDWIKADSGVIQNFSYFFYPSKLAKSGNNLLVYGENGVYITLNDGTIWNKVMSAWPENAQCSILRSGRNTLYAYIYWRSEVTGIDSQFVFYSTDHGINWTRCADLPNTAQVYSLAVNGESMFIGTQMGCFASTDNGQRWLEFYNGFPTAGNSIPMLSANSEYVFALLGKQVWRRPIAETRVVFKSIKPNIAASQLPFLVQAKHKLIFNFNLLNEKHILVSIFNVAGFRIMTLVDKKFSSGSHSVTIDTKNIPAGYYVFKMLVGLNTYTKSISILR